MTSSSVEPVSSASIRRRFLSLGIIFASCVAAANLLLGDNGVLDMYRSRARYNELEQALAAARATNAALLAEGRRYKEDLTTVEEAARRDLGMIKEGEKVFIIRDVVPRDLQKQP